MLTVESEQAICHAEGQEPREEKESLHEDMSNGFSYRPGNTQLTQPQDSAISLDRVQLSRHLGQLHVDLHQINLNAGCSQEVWPLEVNDTKSLTSNIAESKKSLADLFNDHVQKETGEEKCESSRRHVSFLRECKLTET